MSATTPVRLILVTIVLLETAHGHELRTHANLTEESVAFLLQARPQALKCADERDLVRVLQIGTEKEDDGHRFMYHFFENLDYSILGFSASASCDSIDWGFFSDNDDDCRQTGIPGSGFAEGTDRNEHTWDVAVQKAPQGYDGFEELG